MARIWNVRLNLDEFNMLMALAGSQMGRSEVMDGLFAGFNGIPIPEGERTLMFMKGHQVGSEARAEAEGHVEKMSQRGKVSAESRKARFGTSQPNARSSSVRTDAEQMPNQSNNLQSTRTTTPKPPRGIAKKGETTPIPADLLPFLEHVTAKWPRKSHDGRRVTVIRPVDAWDKICKNRGTDEPKVPINAALAYLESNPTEFVIGMDNFFGVARKYTRYVVED